MQGDRGHGHPVFGVQADRVIGLRVLMLILNWVGRDELEDSLPWSLRK